MIGFFPTKQQLRDAATTRAERESARRRAIEQVLLAYGLMREIGDVSHNFKAAEGTNQLVATKLANVIRNSRRPESPRQYEYSMRISEP
jgi:hypothetical protein